MAGRRTLVGSGSGGGGRTARVQVLLEGERGSDPGTALLLCYRQRRWYLEGIYE